MKIQLLSNDPQVSLLFREASHEFSSFAAADCGENLPSGEETGENSSAGEDTLSLRAVRSDEPGFHLVRRGNSAEITYNKASCFGRALTFLTGHQDEEELDIAQSCAFEEFGIMLDTSRNAVPRPETLKRWIRLALLQGYNVLGLYMEDTYLVDSEPYFGYMRGAYSHDDLKEIDAYGASLGLEVRPYIQTLGHLNQLTRHRDYGPVWDTDSILLVDEPRTYELLDHMIGTLADCFTTRTFNIGMDEAHMLGRGRYMDNHGPVNRTDLMLRHLGKVMEICRRYGVRAQMWSDMFYSEPYTRYGGKRSDADVALLPADVDPVFWYYDETHKDFYDQAFDGQRRMFGKNCHYAGAARKWTGFAPNNRFSIEVGKASLTSAAEHEVRSAVLTAWGDNGSEASMFSILPVIWYDSALAYEYLGRAESDIGELKPDDKAFCALTGMSYERYMAVDALRWFGYPAYSSNADKFLLYNDPLQGVFDSVVPQIGLKAHYEEALSDIRRTVPLAGRFAYLFETLEKLAALLVLKCDLGYRLTRAYQAGDREQLAAILDEIPVIVSRLDSFEASFRAQWMKENRSFGYEIQSQRLGGLRARLLYVADALKAYLDGSLESIEELEITKLPFDLSGDSEVFNMEYNQHRNMVSFNIC